MLSLLCSSRVPCCVYLCWEQLCSLILAPELVWEMLWKSLLRGSCRACPCRSWGGLHSHHLPPTPLPGSAAAPLLHVPVPLEERTTSGRWRGMDQPAAPGSSLPACSALGGGSGTWSGSGPLAQSWRSPIPCLHPETAHGSALPPFWMLCCCCGLGRDVVPIGTVPAPRVMWGSPPGSGERGAGSLCSAAQPGMGWGGFRGVQPRSLL